MKPSRRRLLGTCGVVAASAIAGCTDAVPGGAIDGWGDSGRSDSESSGDAVADDAPVRVTLTIDETRTFFESQHVGRVGSVEQSRQGVPYLPLRLTDGGVETATEAATTAGLGERYEDAEIAVFVDGEALNRFGVEQALADSIVDGEWDGRFRMLFGTESAAASFRETLVGGSA